MRDRSTATARQYGIDSKHPFTRRRTRGPGTPARDFIRQLIHTTWQISFKTADEVPPRRTTRRKDRPSTPPIPRWCLLAPCGIRTRRCSACASSHTFPHVHSHSTNTHMHLRQHVRARTLARTLPCMRTRTANCTAWALARHLHSTGICTHLRPRATVP